MRKRKPLIKRKEKEMTKTERIRIYLEDVVGCKLVEGRGLKYSIPDSDHFYFVGSASVRYGKIKSKSMSVTPGVERKINTYGFLNNPLGKTRGRFPKSKKRR